ncbi:hypothetical protein CEY04_25345 [Achromobacter sp. HZ28]|nr:hypothetical protein CEY05_26510 [Achromobacter sp. HZ34]OWT71745.1 hypothetical protein CEY04_25345 [Achromobacter sp. HZ28]
MLGGRLAAFLQAAFYADLQDFRVLRPSQPDLDDLVFPQCREPAVAFAGGLPRPQSQVTLLKLEVTQ